MKIEELDKHLNKLRVEIESDKNELAKVMD